MARDEATERLRQAAKQAGLPPAVDRKIRGFRTSIASMMGEDAPPSLLDFDNTLLKELERSQGLGTEELTDRITRTVEQWQTTPRNDFYGLTPAQLQECLLKLEDLSFRDGVRFATEDPRIVASMFVLLKSGNIDYRKGAIFTLDEVAKKDPTRIDFDIFSQIVTGPYTKDQRVTVIENATEFGRILGRMLRDPGARKRAQRFVQKLAKSGDDAEVRIALKAYTHLSKVAAEDVDIAIVQQGLASANDFNRETSARILQNLAKKAPGQISAKQLEAMASDPVWAVRQVAQQALVHWHKHQPDQAETLLRRLEASSDDNARKIAQGARKTLTKKRP